MANLILTSLLASLSLVQQTDTTLQVRADARLKLENPGGLVTIRTWERAELRVRADHSKRSRIVVHNRGQVVIIDQESERGPGSIVDYEITLPRSMHLDLEGSYSDFDIEGAGGQVVVETLEGNISLRGGSERIQLESVHGSITLTGASGNIKLETVNDNIRVSDSSGELAAETVNGKVELTGVDFIVAEATTFNGSILYDGPIRDNGRYWFATHRGGIQIVVPDDTNATVSVATGKGRFRTNVPIERPEAGKRRFSFTLGTGSASLELESFGGTITLRRGSAN